MKETIFREYDIRGVVGQDFVIDHVYDLSCAIAYYMKQHAPEIKKIAIGMDGRIHSPCIKDIVCNALQSSGLEVLFIGLCTSPVLYFSMHQRHADAGIMITASHNPSSYNGLKLCLGTHSLWGQQIRDIKEIYLQRKKLVTTSYGVYSEQDVVSEYVTWMTNHFKHMRGWDEYVVIDCANGASGAVIPALVECMQWRNAQILYPEVDGTYPHHEADPVVYENMMAIKQVLDSSNAIIGVGLDGDADRMGAMLKSGYHLSGDQLLGFFTQGVFNNHSGSVVCDVKTSQALFDVLAAHDIESHTAPCGHAIIKDHMRKTGALLGGELSCHFMFADRYFGYDDGIYAMMRLFEMIHAGNSIESYIASYPHYYSSKEFRLACDPDGKQKIIDVCTAYLLQKYPHASVQHIDGARIAFDDEWILIRASNTQSMISVRFESKNADRYKELHDDLIIVLAEFVDIAPIVAHKGDA